MRIAPLIAIFAGLTLSQAVSAQSADRLVGMACHCTGCLETGVNIGLDPAKSRPQFDGFQPSLGWKF